MSTKPEEVPQQERLPLTITVTTITPAYAAYLLSTSLGNRALRRNLIRRYAAFMQGGEWWLNGETIVLDWHGRLMQGHHRLTACVESGASFQTLLVTGIDPAAADSLDGGAARTPGDHFARTGIKNANKSATAYGLLWYYEQGKTPLTGGSESAGPFIRRRMLQEHPGLEDSVASIRWSQRGVSISALAMCHYVFSRLDKEQADTFFNVLTSGIGYADDSDPIYRLHLRFMAAARRPGARIPSTEQIAITILAWNAYRAKRSMRTLKWDSDKPFPRAV